jgi:hypothetical protein
MQCRAQSLREPYKSGWQQSENVGANPELTLPPCVPQCALLGAPMECPPAKTPDSPLVPTMPPCNSFQFEKSSGVELNKSGGGEGGYRGVRGGYSMATPPLTPMPPWVTQVGATVPPPYAPWVSALGAKVIGAPTAPARRRRPCACAAGRARTGADRAGPGRASGERIRYGVGYRQASDGRGADTGGGIPIEAARGMVESGAPENNFFSAQNPASRRISLGAIIPPCSATSPSAPES